ncbi:MAG: amidohydrolase [Thermoflavifilum sp.]|nr:amidohydrolase [Thermoflavifilum sp.]
MKLLMQHAKFRLIKFTPFPFIFLFMMSYHHAPHSVDLIIYNGHIYTVDSAFRVVQAMAIVQGKILATGTDQQILQQYTAPKKIDLQGKFVYPGFIDAHAHFYAYALSLLSVDLTGTKTWEEVLQRLQAFARQHPEGWLLGRGWDQNDWPGQQFPDRAELDRLFPDRPVLLTRVDGHAAIANGAALRQAGIRPGDTIEGGLFMSRNGCLTGVLIDNAVERVARMVPSLNDSLKVQALQEAEKRCFTVGLTTVADCGLPKHTIDFLDSLQRAGQLRVRIYAMASDDPENYAYYLKHGPYQTDRMHVCAFKLYADGALGSRGACLLEPYSDQPGWYGFLLKDKAYFDSIAHLLIHSPFQMCTHAIGDSANRVILQIYASVLKPGNDRRWRIEHAQVVHPDDIHLFGDYAIIPSVQPTHATSDMYWAGERLGVQRLHYAYAFQDLLRQNGWIPLGTDFPVEDIDPRKTFYAAIFRQDANGYPPGGFQPENALTREQALCGMTIWAARAQLEDAEKGSLEPGKFADFVVMDQDLMHAKPYQVLQSKVLATFIAGQQVFPDELAKTTK